MAYIRADSKLPSGISGWYIYYDINGKMLVSSPGHYNEIFHTKEDLIVIRDIFNEAIADMEAKEREEKEEKDI